MPVFTYWYLSTLSCSNSCKQQTYNIQHWDLSSIASGLENMNIWIPSVDSYLKRKLCVCVFYYPQAMYAHLLKLSDEEKSWLRQQKQTFFSRTSQNLNWSFVCRSFSFLGVLNDNSLQSEVSNRMRLSFWQKVNTNLFCCCYYYYYYYYYVNLLSLALFTYVLYLGEFRTSRDKVVNWLLKLLTHSALWVGTICQW